MIIETIGLLFTSMALASYTLLYWLFRVRANGQGKRARQFVGLLALATFMAWLLEANIVIALVDDATGEAARKLGFWFLFAVAPMFLIWSLIQKPVPVPVAQVDMDRNGLITRWNETATTLLGYTAAEAIGQPVVDLIIPEALKQDHLAGLAHYRATGEAPILNDSLPTVAQRKDGKIIEIDLLVTRHFGLEGVRFMAIILPAALRLT